MTSDERIEIAERLREAAVEDGHLGRPYGEQGFQVTLRRIIGTSNPMRPTLYARLADLIDPTCHVVTEQPDGGVGEFVGQSIGYVCSSCGHDMPRDRFTGAFLPFCPHCGARLVTRDGDE